MSLCQQCGEREVEGEREVYAIPTCFKCLPPPRSIPVRKTRSQLAAEQPTPIDAGRSAWISGDGLYRYDLFRTWDESKPRGVFIGLNPSTADATKDDHTITKEIEFGKRFGWGGFRKLNLFPWRSTDPKGLWAAADPVGHFGDEVLSDVMDQLSRGELTAVVAAWGAFKHRRAKSRVQTVLYGPLRRGSLMCIGEPTKDGSPPHPLMLGYERTLRVWRE